MNICLHGGECLQQVDPWSLANVMCKQLPSLRPELHSLSYRLAPNKTSISNLRAFVLLSILSLPQTLSQKHRPLLPLCPSPSLSDSKTKTPQHNLPVLPLTQHILILSLLVHPLASSPRAQSQPLTKHVDCICSGCIIFYRGLRSTSLVRTNSPFRLQKFWVTRCKD